MANEIPCNLCGNEDAAPLFSTVDRLLPGRETYHFVCCNRCGLIYVNPQPSWEERAAHYPLAYRGYRRLQTASSPLQRWSMAYGLRKRWNILAAHCDGGRLLDIGCGGGDFLHRVAQHPAWQVYGVERTPAMALAARRTYGLSTMVGDLLSLPFPASRFDAVTLWTVLEHTPNPALALQQCARLLRSGGVLVVRTVMAESRGARLFGPCWVGYDAPRILFVFSRPTLRQLLERAGFDVLGMQSRFHDFHPFLWSLRNRIAVAVPSPRLRETLHAFAASWPVRLLTFPFFALQTRRGENSFVTAIARKR